MKKVLITLTAFTAFTLSAFAQTAPKILTVDMVDLYSKYNKAIDAQKKFESTIKTAQDEINEMLESGMKMGQEFQELSAKANNPALTEDARKKFEEQARTKAEEIQKKEVEINNFKQSTDQTLAARRQAVVNEHLYEIKNVVEKIAKQQKASFVLNSGGGMLMYFDPASDITKEAIKVLNSKKS